MAYKLGGIGLVLLGVFFIIFGNTRFTSSDDGAPQGLARLPVWIDQLIKWSIAGMCLWFGVYLVFSEGHIV